MNSHQITKGFITISLFIVATSSISAQYLSRGSGYEPSIYWVLPVSYWVFLSVLYIIGIFLLVVSSRSWSMNYGWFAVGIATYFLVTLILTRNYFSFGLGDGLYHIGAVRNISATGHIHGLDIYPLTHVLGVTFQLIPGVRLYSLQTLIPITVSFVYFLGAYLYSREVFSTKVGRISSGVAYMIPTFTTMHYTLTPNTVAFLFAPFLLYILHKNISKYISTCVITIIAINIALTHPLTTIYLILIGGIYYSASILYPTARIRRETMKFFVFLTSIIFFSWYLHFPQIRIGIVRSLRNFASKGIGNQSGQISGYTNALQQIPLSIPDLLLVIIARRGSDLLLLLLGVLSVAVLIYYSRNSTRIPTMAILSSFLFIFFSTLSGLILLTDFILTWSRVLKYAMFFAPLLIGFASEKVLSTPQGGRHALIACLLISLSLLTVIGYYPSTIARESNPQVTYETKIGAEWLFDHGGDNKYSGEKLSRYYRSIYGPYTSDSLEHSGLQSHLSYEENNIYIFINTRIRRYYPTLHPKYRANWQFKPSDFKSLNKSNKIYTNAGTDIWLKWA